MTTAIEELTKLVNERMNDGGNCIAVSKELLTRVIVECLGMWTDLNLAQQPRFDLNEKRGWQQRRRADETPEEEQVPRLRFVGSTGQL